MLTITQNELKAVALKDMTFDDELLVFAGAGTVVKGTIIARREVETAIVSAADGGNTGNGLVTATTVIGGEIVPKIGVYNLEVTEAVTNGGVFKLEDPDGNKVAGNLIMTVSGSKVFTAAGMTFTIADGSTDFAAGDKFTLTVAIDGKTVPFAIAGVGGAQNPLMVANFDIVATGAGNIATRLIVGGHVRKSGLIIDADGTGVNITQAHLDALRHVGILSVDVTELNILDNS